MKSKAFTLIELLVVIVIIGILATISTATFKNYSEDARVAKDIAELKNGLTQAQANRVAYEAGNIDLLEMAEGEVRLATQATYLTRKLKDLLLIQITQSPCTACACRGYNFETPFSTEAQECANRWDIIIDTLNDTTNFSFDLLRRDPWGSPYLVDENETTGNCNHDGLWSAGPDKIAYSGDNISSNLDFYQQFCY